MARPLLRPQSSVPSSSGNRSQLLDANQSISWQRVCVWKRSVFDGRRDLGAGPFAVASFGAALQAIAWNAKAYNIEVEPRLAKPYARI